MLKKEKNIFIRLNGNAKTSLKGFLFALLFDPNLRVHILLERMRETDSVAKKIYLAYQIQRKFNIAISPYCSIGNSLKLPHPIGVVIGRDAIIGNDCDIYQNVTLGQKDGKYPRLGNNVTVYAGAQIIGDVQIGDGAVIGANAVVLNDIPAGARAVGVPAKII